MAIDERKRQKQLAKKTAKRKAVVASKKTTGEPGGSLSVLSKEIAFAALSPLHECMVPKELFKIGLGYVVLSRKIPGGRIGMSAFLVDVFCLGVKNAMSRIVGTEEYGQITRKLTGGHSYESVDPSCARKLVEGAVAYARDLGFSPHPDYEPARRMFGEIDPQDCPTEFTFGKDGKPYYIAGPYETPARSRMIVDMLAKQFGPDGFHYIARL